MSSIDDVPDPESLGEAAELDQEWVIEALAGLDFLDPNRVTPEPMPDAVWEQLTTVLALEQASRSGGGASSEILSFPTGGRRRLNLTSGLIAASVAFLAVGLAVVALRPTGTSEVVAGSSAGSTADTVVAESSAANAPQVLQAGFVPPARAITQSDMAYTPENVVGQIDSMIDGFGMSSPLEMLTMDSPKTMKKAMRTSGFMASDEKLRNCITMLTKSDQSQALIVDRAQYMGSDAGVIVIPAFMAIDISSPPPSNMPITLDIWVVGPNCGEQDGAVLRRFTHTLD
ncbi:MAG: hypothetical protein NWR45_02780 [Candidatus Nanopelagicales bacterium]|jgi:hypothetical protein|nr:hypothetical protein [Candidatus Nanopelagicales bacterium]